MTATDLVSLMPIIVLGAAALALMLVNAFTRSHRVNLALTLAGLAISLATLPAAASGSPHTIAALLIIDQYAIFYIGLLTAATLVVVALSYGYIGRQTGHHDKYYILILLAMAGA